MNNSNVVFVNFGALSISFLEFKELLQILVLLLSVVLSLAQIYRNQKR